MGASLKILHGTMGGSINREGYCFFYFITKLLIYFIIYLLFYFIYLLLISLAYELGLLEAFFNYLFIIIN